MSTLFDKISEIAEEAKPELSFDEVRAKYLEALRAKALALQSDNNFDINEADIRFSTALNLRKIREALVVIVGAGGIGNWQWRILAGMGFKRIAVYDDDTVGIENIGPQAHSIFDIGMPKVESVANNALAYRGIGIIARNRRVETFQDVVDDLGEVPDIIIGCTDSADFRNGFIDSLVYKINSTSIDGAKELPELFLDYRMSLGDWVAYVTPWRAMCRRRATTRYSNLLEWYKSEACFSESEALQQPCTERAIVYTGAGIASYTGALLHWFYSGGREKLYAETSDLTAFCAGQAFDGMGPMQRMTSFSSRDFEFISETPREKKLQKKMDNIESKLREAAGFILGLYGLSGHEILEYGNEFSDDVYEGNYDGKYLIKPKTNEIFVIGHGYLLPVRIQYGLARNPGNMVPRESAPYIVVEPSESVTDRGFVALASELLGTVFWYEDGACYVRMRNSPDGSYLEVASHDRGCEKSPLSGASSDFMSGHLSKVEGDSLVEALRLFGDVDAANEVKEEAEKTYIDPEDLRPDMEVKLDDERLTVLSIGDAVSVRDSNGDVFTLTRRSLRRLEAA